MTGPTHGPRRSALIAAVVVVLALIGVGVVVLRHRADDQADSPGTLSWAMQHALPQGAQFSWTDWGGIRGRLVPDATTAPGPGQLSTLLSKGFQADLTSRSALVDSSPVLQRSYGFSPATIQWELYSQSPSAAVEMLGLPDSLSTAALDQSLRTIGYAPPDADHGYYQGDLDAIRRVGNVTPELTYVYLDDQRHVLLSSDTAEGLQTGIDAYRAADDGAEVPAGLDAVVSAVADGDPLSVALYSGDQACRSLAMANAGGSDQSTAQQLLSQAGEVTPLTGFAMADQTDGTTVVAMSFSGPDEARENATTRAALASGPAPGQGGDFSDRFTLGPVTATGDVVTMVLQPKPGAYLMTDLADGPVLYATC